MTELAAALFVALTTFAVGFQLALAAGMPWGHLANGGRFPGRLPPAMRGVAVAQAGVLVAIAAVVAARAGLLQFEAPGWAIWGVVAFSALSVVLNLATPSRGERLLWAPVAVALLACSVVVALS